MTQITFNFEDFGFAKIGNIRDVRYAHPANTAEYGLVCTIDLQLGNNPVDEGVTYVCHSNDDAVTGKYVWEKCSTAENISPWLPPPEPTLEEKIDFARRIRNQLIAEIDPIATNPMRWNDLNSDEQNQVSQYRNNLRNLPQQSGFPDTIQWPAAPACIARYCSTVNSDGAGNYFTGPAQ